MSYFTDLSNDSLHYLHNSKEVNKEMRLYAVSSEKINNWPKVNSSKLNDISDECWMVMAEEEGTVWSLSGFSTYYNNLSEDTFIRIL